MSNLSDEELLKNIQNDSLDIETLEKDAGKKYTWEIVITIAVIIIGIILGVFIYLWTKNFISIKYYQGLTDDCNATIANNKTVVQGNETKLDQCITDSKEIQNTSLGTYVFDTRSFSTKLKRFIKVDSPNINSDKIGIYPFSVIKETDQDSNFLEDGQYPTSIDKIDTNLYTFIYKPPPPYPNTNTAVLFRTDTCPYWQVINRLKTGWSWELGYQTSSDLNGAFGSTYYRVSNGVGDTDKIPDGGTIINSGNIIDVDFGSGVSCIGQSSLSVLTIYDPGQNKTQKTFTPGQNNFNITIFHPDDAPDTGRAVIGFSTNIN